MAAAIDVVTSHEQNPGKHLDALAAAIPSPGAGQTATVFNSQMGYMTYVFANGKWNRTI